MRYFVSFAKAHGVIGNTDGFGPSIQGSSPCGPATY
jgi:hypothetical protein